MHSTLAWRFSVLSAPRGEPFAEKLALNSRSESLAQQRGTLAQEETNVRRSARIGVFPAPNASTAKRSRAHFFRALARAMELVAHRGMQVGPFPFGGYRTARAAPTVSLNLPGSST